MTRDKPPGKRRPSDSEIAVLTMRNGPLLLAALDEAAERVEQRRLRIYGIAEEAAAMPLDQVIAYLDELQATRGDGIPPEEWAPLKENIDAFRCLAEPLRTLARVYSRLEDEHRRRVKRERPS